MSEISLTFVKMSVWFVDFPLCSCSMLWCYHKGLAACWPQVPWTGFDLILSVMSWFSQLLLFNAVVIFFISSWNSGNQGWRFSVEAKMGWLSEGVAAGGFEVVLAAAGLAVVVAAGNVYFRTRGSRLLPWGVLAWLLGKVFFWWGFFSSLVE